MARKPRIHVAGALYHVILRGNNRQRIFVDDKDRYRLQDLIDEGARKFRYRLLGYCWMGNHIHAALEVGAAPLSAVMHHIGFRYTRYFNWRHKRVGHLFQGRYSAILVDSDSYLLQLIRYIHMNPVRARLADDPGAWRWSSHRAYLGEAAAPSWLATAPVLERFNARMPRARAAYSRYMRMPEEIVMPTDFKSGNRKCGVLGDDAFARQVRRTSDSDADPSLNRCGTAQIVDAVCKASGIAMEALCASRRADVVHARSAAARLVSTHGDGNLTALARLLAHDPSTLSRAAARFDGCEAAEEVAARAAIILANASTHA